MAGKLHIHVMYLSSALLMAIILLAVSKEGEAKPSLKPVLCPRVAKMGLVTSSQSCTSLCKKKFGALYSGSVLTNKKSGVYSLEGLSTKRWVCGCKVRKRRGKKCPSDSDSSDSDSDGSSSSSGSSSSGSDSGSSSSGSSSGSD